MSLGTVLREWRYWHRMPAVFAPREGPHEDSVEVDAKFFDNLADLKELDWDCLYADRWNDFDDGKRTRCAEILVPGSVPLSRVARAVVSNEPLRDELTRLRWPTRVDVRPEGFF